MTTFEKLEFTADNTNDINLLRDMFIEVINNNHVDYDSVYYMHKDKIDKLIQKDISL